MAPTSRFGAAHHLLDRDARGTLYLHHAGELEGQVLWRADVERHTSHVTLMDGAHDLGHHRITHLLGESQEFLFRGADHLGHHRDAGTGEHVAHGVGSEPSAVFSFKLQASHLAEEHIVQAGDVDTVEFHLMGGWLRGVHDARQGRGQRHLVAEVDMSLRKELGHLWAGSDHAGQDGEDGFAAATDAAVEHIIGLVELGEAWCAVDDGDGIDIVETVFAVVDDGAQLCGCARGEEVDGVAD